MTNEKKSKLIIDKGNNNLVRSFEATTESSRNRVNKSNSDCLYTNNPMYTEPSPLLKSLSQPLDICKTDNNNFQMDAPDKEEPTIQLPLKDTLKTTTNKHNKNPLNSMDLTQSLINEIHKLKGENEHLKKMSSTKNIPELDGKDDGIELLRKIYKLKLELEDTFDNSYKNVSISKTNSINRQLPSIHKRSNSKGFSDNNGFSKESFYKEVDWLIKMSQELINEIQEQLVQIREMKSKFNEHEMINYETQKELKILKRKLSFEKKDSETSKQSLWDLEIKHQQVLIQFEDLKAMLKKVEMDKNRSNKNYRDLQDQIDNFKQQIKDEKRKYEKLKTRYDEDITIIKKSSSLEKKERLDKDVEIKELKNELLGKIQRSGGRNTGSNSSIDSLFKIDSVATGSAKSIPVELNDGCESPLIAVKDMLELQHRNQSLLKQVEKLKLVCHKYKKSRTDLVAVCNTQMDRIEAMKRDLFMKTGEEYDNSDLPDVEKSFVSPTISSDLFSSALGLYSNDSFGLDTKFNADAQIVKGHKRTGNDKRRSIKPKGLKHNHSIKNLVVESDRSSSDSDKQLKVSDSLSMQLSRSNTPRNMSHRLSLSLTPQNIPRMDGMTPKLPEPQDDFTDEIRTETDKDGIKGAVDSKVLKEISDKSQPSEFISPNSLNDIVESYFNKTNTSDVYGMFSWNQIKDVLDQLKSTKNVTGNEVVDLNGKNKANRSNETFGNNPVNSISKLGDQPRNSDDGMESDNSNKSSRPSMKLSPFYRFSDDGISLNDASNTTAVVNKEASNDKYTDNLELAVNVQNKEQIKLGDMASGYESNLLTDSLIRAEKTRPKSLDTRWINTTKIDKAKVFGLDKSLMGQKEFRHSYNDISELRKGDTSDLSSGSVASAAKTARPTDPLRFRPAVSYRESRLGKMLNDYGQSSESIQPTATASSSQISINTENEFNTSMQDPALIYAITQTMIGEYLTKHTRPLFGVDLGLWREREKGHQRYFWLHPYTKTLNWSAVEPHRFGTGRSGRSFVRSTVIKAVTSVYDPSKWKGSHAVWHDSIVVEALDGSEVRIRCPDITRHEIWFLALNFCVLRSTHTLSPGLKRANSVADTRKWSLLRANSVTSKSILSRRFDGSVKSIRSIAKNSPLMEDTFLSPSSSKSALKNTVD